jgi:integrase
MPRKGSKYSNLLKDKGVQRWLRNLARGSPLTAEVTVRRLGKLCEFFNTDPRGLLDWAKKDLMDFQDSLEDFIGKLESEGKSPGYIQGFLKVVKSWLRYNNINLTRRIKIKNSTATPTIENEKVPSQEELAKILRAPPPRIKAAISLMAFAGLRPQSIGNYDGSDGLMLKDLPELRIEGKEVVFEKIPTMVIVRSTLSKAKHKYFTFLGSEGCTYLKEYLEQRIRGGEELKPESPLIAHERMEAAEKRLL